MSKSNNLITDETIKKALETLGISVTEDTFQKAEPNELGGKKEENKETKQEKVKEKKKPEFAGTEDEIKKAKSAYKELKSFKKAFKLKKSEHRDKYPENEATEDKEGFEKSMCEMKDLKKAFKGKKKEFNKSYGFNKTEKKPDEPLEKAQVSDIVKSELNSFSGKFDSITLLLTNALNENKEIKKSLSESNDIIGKLNSVVVEMGNHSLGRKSILSSKAIEKSFNSDFGSNNDGKKVLSLSKDKQEIEDTLLDLSNIEKGEQSNINMQYANAATLYNTSRTLDRSTINDLFSKNIKIVD